MSRQIYNFNNIFLCIMCVCAEWKLLLRRNYFTIFIIYYLYINLSLLLLWNLYGFFLILIGHLVDYIDTHIFMIYFEISVGNILLIVFLIAVCVKRHNQLWMWRYINKILLYYNKIYNFLQIIVVIIINYYYIIYN